MLEMRNPPLWAQSATELVAAQKSGEASAVAITQSVLAHIDAAEGRLKAYLSLDREGALSAAQALDKKRENGADLGPLHGVPVGVKDLIAVKGQPLTWASRAFADQVPDEDCTAVARLRAAGAVLLGKTATPEFGHKTTTDSPMFGPSRNPWNEEHTCGGSSGGAGIAAAMGFGPLQLTSDGAGSGRIPAACCGVVGLKPTWGAVPHETTSDLFGSLTQLGQMARSVADVALMFNACKGPDPADPPSHGASFTPVTLPEDPVAALQGLRLRVARRTTNSWLHPQIAAAFEATLQRLTAAGALIVEDAPERSFDTPSALTLMRAYQSARFGHLLEEFGPKMDRTARLGLESAAQLSFAQYRDAQRARSDLFRDVEASLKGVDLFVTPTLASLPPPVTQQSDGALIVDGIDRGPLRTAWYPYTIPYNATGHPAISVPMGFAEGLPLGVQFIAPWHQEARLLSVAAALEELAPWARVWPPAAQQRLQP